MLPNSAKNPITKKMSQHMVKVFSLVAVFVVLLSITASSHSAPLRGDFKSATNNHTQPGTFDRILVINFENQPLVLTLLHEYFRHLLRVGALLSHYYGVTHPSQPNYVCQIGGDQFNCHGDGNVNINATNLVDLLEAKGLTWKSYQENYPKEYSGTTTCFTDAYSPDDKYYRKHNPFMSFDNIRNNPNRCKNIVSGDQLEVDIASGQLPHLMYYTPNIDNDGHNTGLIYANDWLSDWLPSKLNNAKFMKNTLIFITFDEDDYLFGNHIYAVAIGPMVEPGTVDHNTYNHFSLLRTIEDNFSLGTLGRNDAKASSFSCFNK